MRQIAIEAIPNQTFTIRLDNNFYRITIKETKGVMVASVIRDNVTIISNILLVTGTPVLPYLYMEDGNFTLITLNGELPFYTQFGITQFLIYASVLELGALRATA